MFGILMADPSLAVWFAVIDPADYEEDYEEGDYEYEDRKRSKGMVIRKKTRTLVNSKTLS